MFKLIADNRNPNSLSAAFRKSRTAFFRTLIAPLEKPVRVLDVGGTEQFWDLMGMGGNPEIFITLLNLKAAETSMSNCVSMAGDARSLDFAEKSFDVVFSNSVIEHVGGFEDQARMASEICRVGRRYFVQTPNKYFPIEPHFVFPFFQFLPLKLQVWLLMNFRLGWFHKTPDMKEAVQIIESIRLLDENEFRQLFPSAAIRKERFLGLTKSFIAYGGWER